MPISTENCTNCMGLFINKTTLNWPLNSLQPLVGPCEGGRMCGHFQPWDVTVVSNYRFYQVGLSWRSQTSKVHYFFLLNARTKTKPVPESLLEELLDRRFNHIGYTFFLLLMSFSPRHNIEKTFFMRAVNFCLFVFTPYFKVLPMTFQEQFLFWL